MAVRAAALVLTMIVPACGTRVVTPTVQPQSATVTGLATSGLSLRVVMAIHNPNAASLSVRSVRARVTARGRDLGTVELPSTLELPAGRWTTLSTDLTVPWLQLPGLGLGAVLGGAVPYHVEGVVQVAGPAGVTVSVPFAMDGEVPRSMLLRLPAAGPAR